MIYTLTLNPALDYDMYLNKNVELGNLNLATEVNYRAGGKGINVSKLLKNLDVDSTAIGFVAGFVGDFIKKDIISEGINEDFIDLEGITRINVKLNANNEETELTGISPQVTKEKIEELLNKMNQLQPNDVLVLSGSIPDSITSDFYKLLSEKVVKGVKIVLDTRGNLLEQNLHNNLLIKPNIHELREMFNEKLETKEEIVLKCKYFLDRGVENIIISKGGDGALLINKNVCLEASVPKGKLINSIGAGDSMVGGFVAGIEKGLTVEDSFKLAVASGSATAYSYGIGEKELIYKLFDEIEIISNKI